MASTRTQEAASSSYSATPRWIHDVFISFRGDTRKNFTDHLYTALDQRGILTFIDDKLERGEEISSELEKAIKESRIALIVFSEDYASSRWTLQELVKILECKKTMGQVVLPIFYGVDPSDVRNQSGCFAEAFVKLEKRFNKEMKKVQLWSEAMTESGNLPGLHLQNVANGYESKFIKIIVEEVLTKLNHISPLAVAKYPVGMDSRVENVNFLLNVGSNDVRIVGIYGMGGIGKTTIAKAVYNLNFLNFEGSSFLANVRDVSKQPNGLVRLQEQLLRDILMDKELKITNEYEGINMIKRLCCKKILVVLDDLDEMSQLNALARMRQWFGLRSRIIITTRDVHILNNIQVDGKYEVKLLDPNESLELFSWHAFRNFYPTTDYVELSKKVVSFAGGLPLALVILGSFLVDKISSVWENALEKLRSIPNGDIMKKLEISFEALDDNQKNIFLDISCFFIGRDKNYIVRILDGCGFFPEIGIAVLVQRSLLIVDKNEKLQIHDLLQDMVREIVHKESSKDPGKRSRLWYHTDAFDVLTKDMGTRAVEGLLLKSTGLEEEELNTRAFAKMDKLRLLRVNYVNLAGDFKDLSKELRWLCWYGCPLTSIPTDFHLDNLVTLDMHDSKLEEVWEGLKSFKNLKYLYICHSNHLIKTPDFSGVPCLESLSLIECTSLVEIHPSIGHLKKLVSLSLTNCRNLTNLPASIFELRSLKDYDFSGCSKLKLLKDLVNKEFFTERHAKGSALKLLHNSIGFSKNPKSLASPFKSALISPRKIPNFISRVPVSHLCSSLGTLKLRDCNLLDGDIPNDMGSLSQLSWLDLSENNFCSLPTGISQLPRLGFLILENCEKLQSLPEVRCFLYAMSLWGSKFIAESKFSYSDELDVYNYMKVVENLVLAKLHAIYSFVVRRCSLEFLTTYTVHLPDFYNVFSLSHMNSMEPDKVLNFSWNEVPEWFMYRSMESCSLSFEVPLSSDRKLEWLIVSVVSVVDQAANESTIHGFCLRIEIGCFEYSYYIPVYFHLVSTDYMRMVHIPCAAIPYGLVHIPCDAIPFALASGNQVKVSVKEREGFQVKGCGVHLVYGPDEELSRSCDCSKCSREESSQSNEEEKREEIEAPSLILEMLSSLLAIATPEFRRQILSQCLNPIVEKHEYDLAPVITGMLLQLDNLELLLLLESPKSLATKVEEFVQRFKKDVVKKAQQKVKVTPLKLVLKSCPREINNGSVVPSATSNSVGTASQILEMLSSMLAAVPPEYRRWKLAEHLLPLIKNYENDLAEEVTGMLLEMDNLELLLLLKSPESLAAKVEEAVQVLKVQEAGNCNYLTECWMGCTKAVVDAVMVVVTVCCSGFERATS